MKRILLAAALACAAVSTTPALAQSGTAPAVRQAPLSRVLAMLAQRWPGKQLNTQMGDSGGRPTYVIRWQMAKDGRVVEFVVDAESGQLLSGPAG
jgi:uncharacterized membrane protein YkoI